MKGKAGGAYRRSWISKKVVADFPLLLCGRRSPSILYVNAFTDERETGGFQSISGMYKSLLRLCFEN